MRYIALGFFCLGCLSACPNVTEAPVSKTCSKLYAKCKLPDGPLGICNETPCKSGEKGPCLKCISQH